jgi:methyltransferase-like protein 6
MLPGEGSAAAPKSVSYFSCDFPHSSLAPSISAFQQQLSSCSALHPLGIASERALAAGAAQQRQWEAFYSRHSGFFKPRNFLLGAFPLLAQAQHILELGCGHGSSVFPLLRSQAAPTVYASDASAAALRTLQLNPESRALQQQGRLQVFLWDAVQGCAPAAAAELPAAPGEGRAAAAAAAACPEPLAAPPARLAGGMAATLLFFVASTVHPRQHAELFSSSAATLAPGGLLCFRDYGLGDLAQLRAPLSSILSAELHERGDGTLSYYFSLQELRALAEAAGLQVLELSYATVLRRNRKTGAELKRVWCHMLARKRGPAEGERQQDCCSSGAEAAAESKAQAPAS